MRRALRQRDEGREEEQSHRVSPARTLQSLAVSNTLNHCIHASCGFPYRHGIAHQEMAPAGSVEVTLAPQAEGRLDLPAPCRCCWCSPPEPFECWPLVGLTYLQPQRKLGSSGRCAASGEHTKRPQLHTWHTAWQHRAHTRWTSNGSATTVRLHEGARGCMRSSRRTLCWTMRTCCGARATSGPHTPLGQAPPGRGRCAPPPLGGLRCPAARTPRPGGASPTPGPDRSAGVPTGSAAPVHAPAQTRMSGWVRPLLPSTSEPPIRRTGARSAHTGGQVRGKASGTRCPDLWTTEITKP